MNQIKLSCSKIDNTAFQCIINDYEYTSLTDFVHKITRCFNFPFSATYTDLTDRKVLVYSCTFSQTGCPSKLLFVRSTDLNGNIYFTFDAQKSFSKHCFHPDDVHFVQCHRNCFSSDVCNEIRYQTKLDITCGSNIFYDIRRNAIEDERHEDLDSLIDSLQKGSEKRILCNKNKGTLNFFLTVIDNVILESNYADDIAIIDYTAMTNMYGLPIESIIVIDN